MMIKTDIAALMFMTIVSCLGGGVQTNVVDGIAWFYEREDSYGVIRGARPVDEQGWTTPRRVCIPSQFGELKTGLIGAKALECQPWIGELYIPDEVQLIDECAFAACGGLTNVTMAGAGRRGVGGIKDRAFSGCTNLERVVFAERLDYINRWAFSGCSKLKDAVLPKALRVLDDHAFAGCEGLESVRLGGIEIIGENPFSGCLGLRSLEVVPDNEHYTVDSQGMLKTKDGKVLISFSMAGNETVVVPRGVVAIGGGAAMKSTRLRRVRLPSTLRAIDTGAFRGSGIEEVVIPDGVEYLDSGAFAGSALRRVVIGKSVKEIGFDCFGACWQLREVHFRGRKPEYDGDMFAPSNCVLYVVRRKGWKGVTTFHGNTVLDEPGQYGIDAWAVLLRLLGVLGVGVLTFFVARKFRH